MNKKILIVLSVTLILLLGTGMFVYKALFSPKSTEPVAEEEEIVESLPPADPSILVTAALSKTKANTVILAVKGLGSKISTIGYELTYDSEGLIKGVNSGSKPLEVAGKDVLEREVYLGTCSRNVCKPDEGVTKVSVVLEFTDANSKKSQFTRDFDL